LFGPLILFYFLFAWGVGKRERERENQTLIRASLHVHKIKTSYSTLQ